MHELAGGDVAGADHARQLVDGTGQQLLHGGAPYRRNPFGRYNGVIDRSCLAFLHAPLGSPQELGGWLQQVGVVDAPPARVGQVVLAEARELREAVATAVRAVLAGERVPREAIAIIDARLMTAGTRPELRRDPDGLPVLGERGAAESPRRALGLVALDAAQMLGTPEQRARLRACEGCATPFYDRSPGGRRRWCSMERCGNAAKARRHRERGRA
ncbi:MAG TPA: ABATE domain-containing protein [Baekduia sp.]|nr:ABATE domain-containing protein [Baekduia sp.]